MKYRNLELDSFQVQAIESIQKHHSVLVAAPTGCGKTLIADYAVEQTLREKKRIIYTAPIKALSNQKFREFKASFGEEYVGIHTGDVSMNPDAPLLIMTTEIFRNLILEESYRLNDIQYVIFDEIHYLDDIDRGTVWEESIILAPAGIQFICLSATVPNIHDLANWMESVRNCPFDVIVELQRPVPLKHHLFSARYGHITLKGIRKLYKKKFSERKKFLRKKPSSRKIVNFVLKQNRYPILYFCFNRRACERNAEMFTRLNLLTDAEQEKIKALIDSLIMQYHLDDYERIERMREMWESGCAFHHAGILPAAKEIVERLFSSGLIKLLFCTDTFALGVNMPASSVIIDELEKFNGVEFEYLKTRNYNQISGRAGRRGLDPIGYVYSQVVPEATNPVEVERILYGKNERISSRFSASYSTILNLYHRFGENAFEIFKKSLKNYKKGNFVFSRSYQKEETQIRNRLRFLQAAGFLDNTVLTEKGRLAAAVSGYEIQTAQLYYKGSFNDCPVNQLPVILAGLITEEGRKKRKNIPTLDIRLRFDAEKVIYSLRKQELRYQINSPIPELDLSLAAPVYAWANGCTLSELLSFGVPEGDLIRILRMTVQLLRTLQDRIDDQNVADKMHEALLLINRDVVDAQAELSVG